MTARKLDVAWCSRQVETIFGNGPSRPTFNGASQKIVDAISTIFETIKPPLTVRQVYYQLATMGLVPLSQKGYRQAQRILLRVREEGIVPWEHFADRTRERIQAAQWDDAADFARSVAGQYRKDLWQTQDEHVEFWLEKDALSGFVSDVLDGWGVPLYVARGFASATFVHEAAAALGEIDKPKFIYYLGDHDPSGMSIEKAVKQRLTAFGAEFTFTRLAISLDDIKKFNLRPLKAKKSDTRTRRYVEEHGGDATIELDALPPDEFRRRIEEAVLRHIEVDEWNRLFREEELEQETINHVFGSIENTKGGAV